MADTIPHSAAEQPTPPRKNSWWRKLGGGSLTLSIILHAILLILAAIWIIRIIPPPKEKTVDFMPSGGGGGNPASQERNMQKQRAAITKPNLSRIAVSGVSSAITLPDMSDSPSLSSLGSLSSGSMTGGLGGSGSGGGRGNGLGKGFGDGTGPGAGLGTGTANPFGALDPNANSLEGEFFDFKQSSSRKPTGMNEDTTANLFAEFNRKGWRESVFNDYYRAPRKLYQTRLYIPMMKAEAAPAAFQVEKEVQPKAWAVVYRGVVEAPKTGRFRFVGAGDDVLMVRFNGTVVLDHGFWSGTTGLHLSQLVPVLRGEREDRETERILKKDFPVKLPVTFYNYPSITNWNNCIGGIAAGSPFQVTAGTAYPIEILISELPGGDFCAALLIEDTGAKYKKTPEGAPIFPLFRTDASLPPEAKTDNAPPYDPDGPIWKVKKQGPGIGF